MLIDTARAGSQHLPAELAYKAVALMRALNVDSFKGHCTVCAFHDAKIRPVFISTTEYNDVSG
jgi:hypothetical protein